MSGEQLACLVCGGLKGRHINYFHALAGRPTMSERAGNPVSAPCPQAKFDEAIKSSWPSGRDSNPEFSDQQRRLNDAIRGAAIGSAPSKGDVVGAASGANEKVMMDLAADARRQVDEITGVPPVGGKLKGDHYYVVDVKKPISPDLAPYVAECADIIEALGMSFNEGEAFKAIWRLAAARTLGKAKGTTAQCDADKAAHYAGRVAAQIRADDDSKKGQKP